MWLLDCDLHYLPLKKGTSSPSLYNQQIVGLTWIDTQLLYLQVKLHSRLHTITQPSAQTLLLRPRGTQPSAQTLLLRPRATQPSAQTLLLRPGGTQPSAQTLLLQPARATQPPARSNTATCTNAANSAASSSAMLVSCPVGLLVWWHFR